jgi:hypothetical protein
MNLGTTGARFCRSTLFSRRSEDTDHRVKQAVKRLLVQAADLRHEQLLIGREQLAGPGITDDPEGAPLEVGFGEPYGLRVGIRAAGYLAQNPVAATGIGENDGRTQFALGEVRKRERNQYYRAD